MGNKKTKPDGGGGGGKPTKPDGGGKPDAGSKGNIPSPPKEKKQYKVLLIGDSNVGKSSVLVRFDQNKFEDGAVQNLSSELPTTKELTVGDQKIDLNVWDTGGQERFRTITSSFYQGSHGILIVYDITSQDTWANVSRWVTEASRYAPDAAKILVGNKLDMASAGGRVVEKAEVEEYCENCDDKGAISFYEVSAKTGLEVNKVFQKLAEQIVQMDDGANSD